MPDSPIKQDNKSVDGAARRATVGIPSEEEDPAGNTPDRRPSRRLSKRRKLLTVAVAAASAALIGVSAWFLFLPGSPSPTAGDALQTTVTPSSDAGASSDASQADGGQAQTDAQGEAAAGGGGQGDGQSSSSANEPPSPAPVSGQGDAGSSSSGSGGSGQQPASPTVTVSVSVSSSAVGNPVSGGANPTFDQGATVYDALKATGLSYNASNTVYGIYVSSISGLAEKEHGSGSGWMYSVNGDIPMVACDKYVLQDGDSVTWFYTTG